MARHVFVRLPRPALVVLGIVMLGLLFASVHWMVWQQATPVEATSGKDTSVARVDPPNSQDGGNKQATARRLGPSKISTSMSRHQRGMRRTNS